MRVMALDIGEKRIGVAVSDPLGQTALPVGTVERRSREKDLEALIALVRRYQVETLVIGLPCRLNGTLGPAAERVKEFGGLLAERLDLPVHYWDERLTTAAAERVLLAADLSRRRRRRVIDQVAASLILQSYLDRKRAGGAGKETPEEL